MAEGIVHDTESKMEEFKDQLPADEVCFYFLTAVDSVTMATVVNGISGDIIPD